MIPMTFPKTPHNFLLHLRSHAPWAARLFDGARSLSFIGGVLGLKIDPTLWPGTEVHSRLVELEEEASRFFGVGTRIELADAPRDPEYLPFQVNAGKYWNHVAFAAHDSLMHSPRVLAVRKTVYAEKILKIGFLDADVGDIFLFPGDDDVPANLPGLLDRLALLAREGMSYVHFVTPFPASECSLPAA